MYYWGQSEYLMASVTENRTEMSQMISVLCYCDKIPDTLMSFKKSLPTLRVCVCVHLWQSYIGTEVERLGQVLVIFFAERITWFPPQ